VPDGPSGAEAELMMPALPVEHLLTSAWAAHGQLDPAGSAEAGAVITAPGPVACDVAVRTCCRTATSPEIGPAYGQLQ
jgi:hypothetical protein